MKKILLSITSLFIVLICFSQERPNDCYYDEEQGYFVNPVKAIGGMVFTDNYCNSLYYYHSGNLTKIADSPGCGRYFSVSSDGQYVGYKLISENKQEAVVVDLLTFKTDILYNDDVVCGQPVFFNNGIANTVGTSLITYKGGQSKEIYLGTYVNYIAVSPDGTLVACADNDIIYLWNLTDLSKTQVSQSGKMAAYPKFSPDGQKLLYQSGNMFVYEILTQKTFDCGGGLAPQWNPNSELIVFYQTVTNEFSLINSDVFLCNYKDGQHKALTNSSDIAEMNPRFVSEHEVIFDTYTDCAVLNLDLNTGLISVLFDFDGNIDLSFTSISTTKSEVRISQTVPYTHQVYDTPDAHYGYGSCAPTTAIMAVAYYNKLPKWPTAVTKLYPHTSDYGSYVSTRYRFNEHYFEENTTTSGGDVAYGGYGYMWGLGSPNSQMRNYMALHYFESVQEWNSSIVFADVLAEIDADYPLPMCVMLSSAGHLILAKGYIENQHTLIFSDPYGDKNTPSWPSYDGHNAYYDWPGYNNGYENLDYNGSYGVIAWTVTAHANEVVYNDSIIDDVFYHHGFEMNNTENGSQMRYFRDQNAGYSGHSWWTMTEATSDDICWVQWIPELSQEGYYRVSAYIPSINASAENAPYRITHGGGTDMVLIDQADFNDEWAELGVYHFEFGDDFRVYLGDSTGIGSQPICYDAVWFEYIPAPVAAFETADITVCVNQPVEFTNLSTNANSFEWELSGSSIVYSVVTNPEFIFDQSGVYSVKLKAIGPYEADSIIMESLITVFENPVASFSVSSQNLYLPDAFACFFNISSNASTYLWSFGDGQSSVDANPFVYYSAEGSYFVTLSAANEGCPADVFELENPVVVHGPMSVDNHTAQSLSVFPNPASDALFVQSDSEILSVEIFNLLGKSILETTNIDGYIDISNLSEGVYSIIVKTAETFYEDKIVVTR